MWFKVNQHFFTMCSHKIITSTFVDRKEAEEGRKRLRVVSRGFLLQFHPRSQISCNGKLDYSLHLTVLLQSYIRFFAFSFFIYCYIFVFLEIREFKVHAFQVLKCNPRRLCMSSARSKTKL